MNFAELIRVRRLPLPPLCPGIYPAVQPIYLRKRHRRAHRVGVAVTGRRRARCGPT